MERRFARTESEHDVAPLFLKKPLRLGGLLHFCSIATMLSALLERQVRSVTKARRIGKVSVLPEGRASVTPTTSRTLENFADVTWHEDENGCKLVSFPVKLTTIQSLPLDLSAGPPSLQR